MGLRLRPLVLSTGFSTSLVTVALLTLTVAPAVFVSVVRGSVPVYWLTLWVVHCFLSLVVRTDRPSEEESTAGAGGANGAGRGCGMGRLAPSLFFNMERRGGTVVGGGGKIVARTFSRRESTAEGLIVDASLPGLFEVALDAYC